MVVGAAVLVLDALAVALALPVLAVLAALARARVVGTGLVANGERAYTPRHGRRWRRYRGVRVGVRARSEQHRRERAQCHGTGAACRGGAAARPLMTLPVN